MEKRTTSKRGTQKAGEGRPSPAGGAAPGEAAEAERDAQRPERDLEDPVDEASWESFPASDAPPY